MKSMLKLVRRFVLILIMSLVGLLVLNIVLLITFTHDDVSNAGGWTAAEELSEALTETVPGEFVLSKEGEELLARRRAWAILIEDGTGDVIWHSENLPSEIPLHYSAADISWCSLGYIRDFPTTTGAHGDDLIILGHPKDMYWKEMKNTWSYRLIANIPKIFICVLGINCFFVILIYVFATSGILRQIKPIVNGIAALPDGGEVYIHEKGLLSDLAAAINRASELLCMQERALRKKENARVSWISGVSHDIRTPLSMVMGYAGQLEEDASLSEENQKKAGIIRLQSLRMKNLVNDLNLASKLEYNMQPLKKESVNLVAVVRKMVVDFMNTDLDEKYQVKWSTPKELTACMIEGDEALLSRAVQNLLTNAQVHNPDGCCIEVTVFDDGEGVHIRIEDDGIGVAEKQMEALESMPHYLMTDGETKEPRHGLGLMIVKQIVAVHNGTVTFGHGKYGGFAVEISL